MPLRTFSLGVAASGHNIRLRHALRVAGINLYIRFITNAKKKNYTGNYDVIVDGNDVMLTMKDIDVHTEYVSYYAEYSSFGKYVN
jgi:hypothetical protein